MVRRDDEEVGSARTAVAATSETVATSVADSSTIASGGSSLESIGAITPESLTVVASSVYIQLDEFARGGLGRIIRAKDTRTGRIVAIKEMLSSTEDAAMRFAREAMITANLQHPAIVPVYEVGRWTSGKPFYAMKLVSGRPLDQVIASTKTIDDRLALVSHVLAVADALAYAHGERVIHRDLKPHNVLVGAHGETVVIDWGLARRLDEVENPAASHRVISAVPGQTYVGAVMGTPAYMPPEQASGVRVDERADVYAIGAILYHLLAGKAPYSGKTLEELLTRVKTSTPPRLTTVDPSIPADLAAIVEHAMEREPAQRYSSAADLAADLRRFTTGQLVRAHHYTRMQRLGRFISRNRAAVLISDVAVVTGAVGGTIAVRRVMSARDVATDARARAEVSRDEARHRLTEAHVDRSRSELAAGRNDLALAYTIAAAEMNGLDDRLRFIAERALTSLTVDTRWSLPDVTSLLQVPGSYDTIVSSKTAVRRWDPIRQKMLWERVGEFAGDGHVLDPKTMLVVRVNGIEVFDADTGSVTTTLQATPIKKFQGMLGVDRAKRWLAAPVFGGAVALFDLSTRTFAALIPSVLVDNPPLISPDGKQFVFAGAVSNVQTHIYLSDRSGKIVKELCPNCNIARYLGEDIILAEVASRLPAKIRIVDWSGTTKKELMASTTGDVADLVTFDETRFALVLTDGTIEVHDREVGLLWRRATGESASSLYIDGQHRLWMLGNLKSVYLFDAVSGMPLRQWHSGGIGVAVSEDGTRATTMIIGRGLANVEIRTAIQPVAPSLARVRKLLFASNDRVVTSSEDGLVAVVEPGKSMREIVRHGAKVSTLQLLANRSILSSGRDGKTFVHDLETGAQIAKADLGPFAQASPDGSLIAIGTPTGEVFLWDMKEAPRKIGKLTKPLAAVRWSSDGTKFGAVDEKAELQVWDRQGKTLLSLPATNTTALDLTFSKRSTHVARSFNTIVDELHSLVPGVPNITLEPAAPDDHYSLTFSFTEDDSRVALAGTGVLAIWDLPSGKLRHRMSVNTDSIVTAFSRNESLLFSGGIDRRAHVWDVASGLEVTSIVGPSEVYNLEVSPEGDRLAILTLGSAMIWDIGAFKGDLAELKRLAACRIAIIVLDDRIVQRPIDIAGCNAQR